MCEGGNGRFCNDLGMWCRSGRGKEEVRGDDSTEDKTEMSNVVR